MSDTVIATVHASAPRRFLGLTMLVGLGGLLAYLALATPPAWYWQLFLILLATLSFWVAQRMWYATQSSLELTATELRDADGTVLVKVADVAQVDRGAFAFKPSNGFSIKTKGRQDKVWRPGLWWRLGRRVAIGGVTPSSQTKPMADILAAIVSGQLDPERDL